MCHAPSSPSLVAFLIFFLFSFSLLLSFSFFALSYSFFIYVPVIWFPLFSSLPNLIHLFHFPKHPPFSFPYSTRSFHFFLQLVLLLHFLSYFFSSPLSKERKRERKGASIRPHRDPFLSKTEVGSPLEWDFSYPAECTAISKSPFCPHLLGYMSTSPEVSGHFGSSVWTHQPSFYGHINHASWTRQLVSAGNRVLGMDTST